MSMSTIVTPYHMKNSKAHISQSLSMRRHFWMTSRRTSRLLPIIVSVSPSGGGGGNYNLVCFLHTVLRSCAVSLTHFFSFWRFFVHPFTDFFPVSNHLHDILHTLYIKKRIAAVREWKRKEQSTRKKQNAISLKRPNFYVIGIPGMKLSRRMHLIQNNIVRGSVATIYFRNQKTDFPRTAPVEKNVYDV